MRYKILCYFLLIISIENSYSQVNERTVYYDSIDHKWRKHGTEEKTLIKNQSGVFFDSEIQKVKFDTVINIPNKNKNELFELCKKYFLLGTINKQRNILEPQNGFLYIDSNEIIVSAIYKTFYRPHGNTHDYNCIYNLSVKFKDGKIKCNFSDFVLYPYEINTSSMGWFGSSGFGVINSKSPTSLQGKTVEPIFLRGHTSKRNKLFPLMNAQINRIVRELSIFLNTSKEKENDW